MVHTSCYLVDIPTQDTSSEDGQLSEEVPIERNMSRFKSQYMEIHSEQEKEAGFSYGNERQRWRGFDFATLVLSSTTLIFGLLSFYLLLQPAKIYVPESFKKGYSTEWNPAKDSIRMEKVKYGSSLLYNTTSKTYYRHIDPLKPQYVGKPGPEIDDAWDKLLDGQYLLISKEEALHLDDIQSIQGYYIAEVEVMHSLHCVNAIRKALSASYYKPQKSQNQFQFPVYWNEIHIDHCLEQLRQNIQCAGDLTPVPFRAWGEGNNTLLIGTPHIHTCRNWDTFREWYTNRGNMHGKVGHSN